MIAPLLLSLSLALPAPPAPADPWFGEDKLKHFVTSFVATSLAVSGARIAGVERSTSIAVGAGIGVGVGVLKEVNDARTGGIFSYRDILWDLAGVSAAAAVAEAAR